MKDLVTYPNLVRNSILLVFVLGVFAEAHSNNYAVENKNEFVYNDFENKSFNSTVGFSTFTTSKTNASPQNLNFDAKHTNAILPFGVSQKSKHLNIGLKIDLFILYSSLKISPIY